MLPDPKNNFARKEGEAFSLQQTANLQYETGMKNQEQSIDNGHLDSEGDDHKSREDSIERNIANLVDDQTANTHASSGENRIQNTPSAPCKPSASMIKSLGSSNSAYGPEMNHPANGRPRNTSDQAAGLGAQLSTMQLFNDQRNSENLPRFG